jgi:hypothetical protein
MNTENSQQPREISPEYTTPTLVRHGMVAELTNSSGGGSSDDGAGEPIYTSSLT